jgi:putative flippase GtrA
MKNFVVGVVGTLVAIVCGVFLVSHFGLTTRPAASSAGWPVAP